MNPENMCKLQMEVRQNNDEMLNSVNDLLSWEKDIKEKEKFLFSGEKPKNTAPIRNEILKSLKKEKNNVKGKTTVITKITSDKDWDKYDANKECSKIDSESEKKMQKYRDMAERVLSQTEKIKDEGNQQFKAGKYHDAVITYTHGITISPYNTNLLSNRALAYMKLERWSLAELDCNSALNINGNLVKVLMRRGVIRRQLEQTKQAMEDFEKALKLEPANKQLNEEIQKTKELLTSKTASTPQGGGGGDGGIKGRVLPIPKPSNPSNKPMTRVMIEETSSLLVPCEVLRETAKKCGFYHKGDNYNNTNNYKRGDGADINGDKNEDCTDINGDKNKDGGDINVNKNKDDGDINVNKNEDGGDKDVNKNEDGGDKDEGSSLLNDKLILPDKTVHKKPGMIVEMDGNNDDGNKSDDDDNDNNNNKKETKINKNNNKKIKTKREIAIEKRAKSDIEAKLKTTSSPSSHAISSLSTPSIKHVKSSFSPIIPCIHSPSSLSTKPPNPLLPNHHSNLNKFSQIQSQSETTCTPANTSISSYQFQIDWKDLKNDDEAFRVYMKSVDPVNFRQMFGEFFDSSILSKIIHTLRNHYLLDNFNDVFSILFYLTQVKRFSMISMFINKQDKEALDEIFKKMEECKDNFTSIQLKQLVSMYQA